MNLSNNFNRSYLFLYMSELWKLMCNQYDSPALNINSMNKGTSRQEEEPRMFQIFQTKHLEFGILIKKNHDLTSKNLQ